MGSESDFIAWLRNQVPGHPALAIGIGDDAAVIDVGSNKLVVTTDLLTDGVDFLLERDDPRRIGRKALAVNLSDLAAMAARPLAAVVYVALPRAAAEQIAKPLFEGMLLLAEKYGVALAGGDTNSWDGPLVIGATLLGTPTERGPLRRSGARPGDRILVTGSFGGSILAKQFDFEPRVTEALALMVRYDLHAGMDVSDGLSLDLSRLAAESGCGAVLDLARIPIAEDARRLAIQNADGQTALDHALADGEDFELLIAASPTVAEQILREQILSVPINCIGEFVAEPGLWQLLDGTRRVLTPRGYEHKLHA